MSTKVIGITGGIGSGKSYVCRLLHERGIPIFYTDIEAKLEMLENEQLQDELRALIGPDVIDDYDRPVKAVLANYICRGPQYADRVNAIIHPRVRERMRAYINKVGMRTGAYDGNHSGAPTVIVESALLFESGFNADCTHTVAVVAPLEVRISRIMQRDGITRDKALEWINLQMPQHEKAALADHIITNDGKTPLLPQLDSLLAALHC